MLLNEEVKSVLELSLREGLIKKRNGMIEENLKNMKTPETSTRMLGTIGKLYEFLVKLDNTRG